MRRKVTLAARADLKAPTVIGHVFGDWAATPRWNSDDTFGPEWRVTHAPSGLALNECYLGELSEVEARRIAEALHAARLPSPPLAEQPDGNGYPQAPHDYRWMVEAVVAEVWS